MATTTSVTEPTAEPVEAAAAAATDDELLADLLVEEISIDGMCGVY